MRLTTQTSPQLPLLCRSNHIPRPDSSRRVIPIVLDDMQCDICFRTGGLRLPFLCPTDARNRLYEPRIQNARVLLEKDALDQEISTLLSQQSRVTDQKSHSLEESPNGPNLAATLAEREQTVDRTQQIITQADE